MNNKKNYIKSIDEKLESLPLNEKNSYLIKLIKKEKNHEVVKYAKEKLIFLNQKLVYSIIHKKDYLDRNKHNFTFDDLVQEGNMGMLKAIKKFNLNKNVKFTTYCYKYINNAIYNAIIKQYEVSVYIYNKFLKEKRLDKIPQLSAFRFDFSYDNNFLNKKPTDTNPEIEYVRQKNKEVVYRFLEKLDNKKQDIIKMRYGINTDREYTYKEIGEKYNITKAAVYKIIKNIINDLKFEGLKLKYSKSYVN